MPRHPVLWGLGAVAGGALVAGLYVGVGACADASGSLAAPKSQLSQLDIVGASAPSLGLYRLPFADGITVKVFDDFDSHRPRGRIDFFGVRGAEPYRVVAAAGGRIMAIQDGYNEQQSGRAAALCHNNYVWIAHPNGEWTNYSHIARGSATGKAHLKVGDQVKVGQYLGDEDAIGCAMLKHLHFEVARPAPSRPIDDGGFLTDNDGGKREIRPRFCRIDRGVNKDAEYLAGAC